MRDRTVEVSIDQVRRVQNAGSRLTHAWKEFETALRIYIRTLRSFNDSVSKRRE